MIKKSLIEKLSNLGFDTSKHKKNINLLETIVEDDEDVVYVRVSNAIYATTGFDKLTDKKAGILVVTNKSIHFASHIMFSKFNFTIDLGHIASIKNNSGLLLGEIEIKETSGNTTKFSAISKNEAPKIINLINTTKNKFLNNSQNKSNNNGDNVTDELLKLKKLLDEDIITKEEFEKLKTNLLNK